VNTCHDALEYVGLSFLCSTLDVSNMIHSEFQPEKYSRVCTTAISMGTNSVIKAGRAEAFADMCRLVELVPLEKTSPQMVILVPIYFAQKRILTDIPC